MAVHRLALVLSGRSRGLSPNPRTTAAVVVDSISITDQVARSLIPRECRGLFNSLFTLIQRTTRVCNLNVRQGPRLGSVTDLCLRIPYAGRQAEPPSFK